MSQTIKLTYKHIKNLFFFLLTSLFAINFTFAQKISIDEAYQILTKNDSLISTKNVYYSPELANLKVKILQSIPVPGKLFDLNKYKIGLKSVTTYNASNDYAVIISGGYNNENNWYRYWNDCSAIYSTLVNIYNYLPSHIYVLISDGISSGQDRVLSVSYNQQGNLIYTRDSSPLDLDGNGTNDIQYSATKSNVSTVFNTLSSILDSEDHLFVFTTDHGGQESGNDAYLYLWGETMRDDEFATELNKVHPGKMTVTMEQCHSGGFIDDISKNSRVISTACSASETSNAMANLTYDEYVYHWISAVAGETPQGITVDADVNDDGWVSMREAFEYAENEDTRNETPQYNSTPNGLGCCIRLSENWNWYISGPSVICSSDTFNVNNVPTGSNVTWTCSPNLTFDHQPGNPKVFTAIGTGSGSVTATINNGNCDPVILPAKTVWVGAPLKPTFISGFISNGMEFGSESIYEFSVNSANQGIDNYNWVVGGGTILEGQGTNTIRVITVKCPEFRTTYFDLSVKVHNGCGWSPELYRTGYVRSGTGATQFVLYPNPANSEVTVSVSDDASLISKSGTEEVVIKTLDIVDFYGNRLKVKKYGMGQKSASVDVSGFHKGFYFIIVNSGLAEEKHTLVVE